MVSPKSCYISATFDLGFWRERALLVFLDGCISTRHHCVKRRLAAQQMLWERVHISQTGVSGRSSTHAANALNTKTDSNVQIWAPLGTVQLLFLSVSQSISQSINQTIKYAFSSNMSIAHGYKEVIWKFEKH